jgi:hypothetical protein
MQSSASLIQPLHGVGGSISNMYAMNAARFKMFPECKEKGIRHLPPLVCFTSQEVRHFLLI